MLLSLLLSFFILIIFLFIVASEASDLIFKIVIFHDVPCCTLVVLNLIHRVFHNVQGAAPRRGGGRFRGVDLTPPRRLDIS